MSSWFKKKWKKFLELFQPTRNSFVDKCYTLQHGSYRLYFNFGIEFFNFKFLTVLMKWEGINNFRNFQVDKCTLTRRITYLVQKNFQKLSSMFERHCNKNIMQFRKNLNFNFLFKLTPILKRTRPKRFIENQERNILWIEKCIIHFISIGIKYDYHCHLSRLHY